MDVTELFVGVDGCHSGWFFVGISGDDSYRFGMLARFAEISDLLGQASLVLVDIPIGLCGAEHEERLCDKAARRAIAPRGATIFPAPARGALGKATYAEGSAENFRLTGRRLSCQSWAIAPKIAQVDSYVRQAPGAGKIREMHPEVAFWALNNKVPLLTRKKKREGVGERIAVLSRHFAGTEACYQEARNAFRRAEVQEDDILDALAGAVTARYTERLKSLPDQPARDAYGLPMEMVYADLDGAWQAALSELPLAAEERGRYLE